MDFGAGFPQDEYPYSRWVPLSEVRETCEKIPKCPVCEGYLEYQKQKLVCSKCHQIIETCCEGGQG